VDLISCNPLEADVLAMIRLYMDLTSCNPLVTDILAVLVLDQGVRGFDSCNPSVPH
jgi:hypothetical protein